MNTVLAPALDRTERAVQFLRDNAGRNQFFASVLKQYDRFGRLSDKQLEAIERNINNPRPARVENTDPITQNGVYRDEDGNIYRVKTSRQSGRLYASLFVPTAQTKSERFVYAKGAIYSLKASNRLTVEQAGELGIQFGICIVCGAELTDAQSVARGIGPVCVQRV
jgi:hypothetical protein